jgi:acetyl-CoA synthetase
MSGTPRPEIEALMAEDRAFPPDPEFAAQANATAELYDEAERDPEAFWARLARERLSWFTPFETTLEWDLSGIQAWACRPGIHHEIEPYQPSHQ